MHYQGIIFDLDGTLVNSLEGLARAMNNVLTRFGYPRHETEAYRYFIGRGIKKLVLRALPEEHRDEGTVAECLAFMREEYQKHWADNMYLYEGIPGLLDELTRLGVKLAILTNKPDNYTELIVQRFLSDWNFAEVIGAREDLPKKPDPTGANLIARKLNIPPENLLYLGDTAVDMETANKAGMFAVGALWGFRSAGELKSAGAKALIKHPLDILDLLDR